MAGLISRKSQGQAGRAGVKSLYVGGIRYSNAAAKFWPSLLDEVGDDFPDCSRIDLAASSATRLERSLLFPEIFLGKGLGRLKDADLQDVMKEALAELEMLGPPLAVQVTLYAGERPFLSTDLPLDCVDSETFPHLLVWPMEWARISPFEWNGGSVAGAFTAHDKNRGIEYAVAFGLANVHLSEGLYRRTLSIVPSIAMLA